MISPRRGLLVLTVLTLHGCADSGSDSPSTTPDRLPSGDDTLPPFGGDVVPAEIGADALSDAELEALDGTVSVDEAAALIPGRWSYTYAGSQCVVTLDFAANGTFVETQLDKVAGGFFDLFDEDDAVELVYDYTTDNGRADCFGDTELLVEEGVTLAEFVRFPDRNTMALSIRASGTGFSRDFVRQ